MAERCYQVQLDDLTDGQWQYIKNVLFPTLKRLKEIARQRREAGSGQHKEGR